MQTPSASLTCQIRSSGAAGTADELDPPADAPIPTMVGSGLRGSIGSDTGLSSEEGVSFRDTCGG